MAHEPTFAELGPSTVLDAVESVGRVCDGRLLQLNSFENRVYQVGLEDDAPLIAKFYRNGRWSDAQIREEHRFAGECAGHDLPVVAPVTHAGTTLFRHGGFRFALFPRLGGHAPPLDDPGAQRVIGRLLGRLHNVGASARFEHRPRIDVEHFGRRPSRAVLASDLLPDGLQAAYESLVDDLLARIETTLEQLPCTPLRLHGDFHPGNVIWRDEAAAIVDLDDARTGPAIQDLWMFLPGERDEREAALAAVLEGYSAFRDFDPTELALIEPLRTLRLIHYAGWIATRADEPAFCRAFPWLLQPRWWEDHVLTLREQLAALDEPPIRWQP